MPYFKSKNFTLYHGDSLKLLKKFPDNKFNMIFADPPYFLSNGTFTCQNGKMVDVKKGDWDISDSLKETNYYIFTLKMVKDRVLEEIL